MFNKIIHLLSEMFDKEDGPQDVQGLNKSLVLRAETEFVYGLTNGRPKGYNRQAVINGHNKIGNFVARGITVQKRKMEESKED